MISMIYLDVDVLGHCFRGDPTSLFHRAVAIATREALAESPRDGIGCAQRFSKNGSLYF